ncbi:MAG TPA: zf-HC2 domain-containing protein [Mycobacteriales bacterium]|nr:zf-HC2 domain-containing protein [Mycobacteriales bacterium]
MTCDEVRISLGVYLVGAIDPAERADVDVHLQDCPHCRAELGEIAMLPSVLDKLSLDDVAETSNVPAPSEALFVRVAERVRREDAAAATELRPRRRWRTIAAAAAAVVVIGGVSVTAVEVLRSSNGPRTVAAVQGSVHMRVALTSQATGTALRVTVSGLANDEHCRLIAVADDGSTDLVSQWDATYAGEAQVTGSTSIATGDLTRLVLLGHDGRRLVQVEV